MLNIKSDICLFDWIKLWLDNYKKGTISEKSLNQYFLLVKRIPPVLLEAPLSYIKPIDLQSFINEFSETASKSYMDKMRTFFRALFEAAKDNGLCLVNTMSTVRIPHIREQPRKSFSADEVKSIIQFAQIYDVKRIGAAVITLLFTGMRRGELLGIKWTDIENHVLTINRAVFIEHNRPKTKEYKAKTEKSLRTIPLLAEVEFILKSLPRHSEYIFCTKNGNIINPRNFSRDYATFFKRLKEAEPSIRHLSIHCCRHTFATLIINNGTDIRTLQELLGHTNIQTTSRYIHPDIENEKAAIDLLKSTIFS